MYALKQLFFSISMNVVATIRHYSPRFQRIIVEYITVMYSKNCSFSGLSPGKGYIFSRVSGHDERVAISLVEVYERVGKSVIWVCKITESD